MDGVLQAGLAAEGPRRAGGARRTSEWGHRWRAPTTGSPVRRTGRGNCTTPWPPSAGCGPAPVSWGSTPTGSPCGGVGRRPPGRAARPDRGRPRPGGRRRHHRTVEPGGRRRGLVRAQRPRRDADRHRERPDGPGHPRGAAARRRAGSGPRTSPPGPARSRTSPPPRRSCCCTGMPTNSCPRCRASGCTRRPRRRAAPSSCSCSRGDHMWHGAPEAATYALARTVDFLRRRQ
jgi:hypothetical protein